MNCVPPVSSTILWTLVRTCSYNMLSTEFTIGVGCACGEQPGTATYAPIFTLPVPTSEYNIVDKKTNTSYFKCTQGAKWRCWPHTHWETKSVPRFGSGQDEACYYLRRFGYGTNFLLPSKFRKRNPSESVVWDITKAPCKLYNYSFCYLNEVLFHLSNFFALASTYRKKFQARNRSTSYLVSISKSDGDTSLPCDSYSNHLAYTLMEASVHPLVPAYCRFPVPHWAFTFSS